MRFLLAFHFGLLVAISLVLTFMTSHDKVLSFALGGLLSGSVVASVLMITRWLLGKKSVARAIAVIVLKYAFIGFIFYRLLWQQKVDFSYFSAGIILMVLTSFATALVLQRDSL